MPNSHSPIGLKTLKLAEYSTIINTLKTQLDISNAQAYYPLFNKLDASNQDSVDCEDYEDNEDVGFNSNTFKNTVLDSKYFCSEINGIITEESDCESDGESDNSDKLDDKDFSNVVDVLCKIQKNDKAFSQRAFIKISPLVEPLRYLEGEFISSTSSATILPNEQVIRTMTKLNSNNNSSYIESSFLYYASKLVEAGKCPTFPYFYGAYNGVKKVYYHDISEDYDGICNKAWYCSKLGKDFELVEIDDSGDDAIISNDLEESVERNIDGIEDIDIDIDIDIDDKGEVKKTLDISEFIDSEEEFECQVGSEDAEDAEDAENSEDAEDAENSENAEDAEDTEDTEDAEDAEDASEISDLFEEDIIKKKAGVIQFAKLPNYPVQLSIMEYMRDTLDQLLDDGYNMSETEWLAILFQISFGLSVAQKAYKFCHNDLHSSNVMFQSTKEKYLYMFINNAYYRIPTFNKIVKIIDFARATFKHNGITFFSDVFDSGGDAEAQYKFPNYKSGKYHTTTAPNPSFDLVRFSATIEERLVGCDKVLKLINKWMTDDNGDNVRNYDDDFSLYIRIAKDCHNAIPKEVLKDSVFRTFKIKQENIPKGKYIYYY